MQTGMSRWLFVIALSTSIIALLSAIRASLQGGGRLEVHFDLTPGTASFVSTSDGPRSTLRNRSARSQSEINGDGVACTAAALVAGLSIG